MKPYINIGISALQSRINIYEKFRNIIHRSGNTPYNTEAWQNRKDFYQEEVSRLALIRRELQE